MIEGLPLSVETLAEVDEHLLRRGPALLESAAVARDIRMSSELALHEMNIRMSEGMSSGALTSADHGMAYRRLSEQMAERNGEAVAAWKLAHESFRDGLRDLLDPEEVSLFEAAWDVASNPIVYRDQNDSGPALDQALALDDLGDEQAEVIREIGADYRIEWTRLSREMAELRGKMSGFGAGTPPEEFDDWRELQQRYQALEFQRDEASLRALRRLARYLEPDQRSRIRALRRLED